MISGSSLRFASVPSGPAAGREMNKAFAGLCSQLLLAAGGRGPEAPSSRGGSACLGLLLVASDPGAWWTPVTSTSDSGARHWPLSSSRWGADWASVSRPWSTFPEPRGSPPAPPSRAAGGSREPSGATPAQLPVRVSLSIHCPHPGGSHPPGAPGGGGAVWQTAWHCGPFHVRWGGTRHEAAQEPTGCSERGPHVAGGQGTLKSGEGALKARSRPTPSWWLSAGRARRVSTGTPVVSVSADHMCAGG